MSNASSNRGHCILSHGFESGPDATKVTALAAAAEALGWTCARPDYTGFDARRDIRGLGDVVARQAHLLALAQTAAARGPLVLAGSSSVSYTHLDVYKRQGTNGRWRYAPRCQRPATGGPRLPRFLPAGW